jgi:hypothetical protein
MGWSISGAPTSGIVLDDFSGTLIVATTTETVACSRNGTLLWESSAFPGSNRPMDSSSVLTAIPRSPNSLRVAYLATDLSYGDSDRGFVVAFDVDNGELLASTVTSGFDDITSTNMVVSGGSGQDVAMAAWTIEPSATAIFQLHFDPLNRSLTWTGQSPWRPASGTPDVYPGIALGPGPGQLAVAFDDAFSLYQGASRSPCVWGGVLTDAYLAHCCEDGCIPYATAAEAMGACDALLTCCGVTNDPAQGTWTLRASPAAAPSPTSESSYLILNPGVCHAT